MADPPGFGRIVRTLRHRNYRIYVSGNSVSLIGSWMQRIAVGWLTWQLTESGFWLGLMACAEFLPAVLLGPFGGVLADRFDRLRIIIVVQSAAFCQAVALFALTALGLMTIELLAALVLVNGIVLGIYQPSRLALVFSLLPREDLSTGIAINSITFNLARFLGPALAGVIIVGSGIAGAFAANAASYLAFLIALSCLQLTQASAPSGGAAGGTARPSIAQQLGEGIRYAARHRGIGPMLLLLSAASLGVRPFVDLLPGFADAVFAGGAETLALLSSSVGIGAVVSGAWIARRGGGGLTRLILVATLLMALAVVAFAATNILWFATASATFAGMCMVATGVSMQTLMQLSVDGAMRGRVLSLYSTVFIGGPAAGALIMGAASELVGLRAPLLGGAALVLLVWIGIWRRRLAIAEAMEPGPTVTNPAS